MTENLLLGTVAMRTGKKIEWDGPNMKVTNVDEAAVPLGQHPASAATIRRAGPVMAPVLHFSFFTLHYFTEGTVKNEK